MDLAIATAILVVFVGILVRKKRKADKDNNS